MKLLLSCLLLMTSAVLQAQKLYEVPELKISFSAPDDLESYTYPDEPLFVGYDNDVLAVEI